jgi:hypothetical protein
VQPALIALSKADLVSVADAEETARVIGGRTGLETYITSALEDRGLVPLINAIARRVRTIHTIASECPR